MQDTREDRRPPLGDALTRRSMLQGLIAALATVAVDPGVRAAQATSSEVTPYRPEVLPPGIRSRLVNDINGIRMHVLEAGFETPGRPAVLLLHGFPELAYSWRKVMGPMPLPGFTSSRPTCEGMVARQVQTLNTPTISGRLAPSTRSATCSRWYPR